LHCKLKRLLLEASIAWFFLNRLFLAEKKGAGKKGDRPVIKPVSRQNKLRCINFGAFIACTNEAIVRNKRNHIIIKLAANATQNKGFFCFRLTKGLQEKPLAN